MRARTSSETGSSMLNAERVGASTEATWQVVLDFLAATLVGNLS